MKPYVDDDNYVVFPSATDGASAPQSRQERMAKGIANIKKEKADDPDGDLGMTIHMDGESFSVAQKDRKANYDSELFTGGPAGESQQEKIARGKAILRKERADDPGSGNLGLNIRMDGESLSIAQKPSLAQYDSELFTGGPAGESQKDKIARGKAILRKERADDPGTGSLGLNIRMDGESLSIAQKNQQNLA